ncbi:shikimate dehydrogenase [Micropruina sp.]|uniref:shikimate dehydrogenase n=1 Tax=Micropruina sp. TaxID=2737536 RepID=UPI0039E3AF82
MTDHYALFGHPVGHSKSPLIHGWFAEATGADLDYRAIDVSPQPPAAFADAVTSFISSGGRGANVTAPFKQQALTLAGRASRTARLAGAANALRFEHGTIHTENFDGAGLRRDIESNLDVPMAGLRVLLMGAGGAVRGALLPFLDAAPAELVLVERTVAKVEALAAEVGHPSVLHACGYPDLDGMGDFDLVVNATSASLSGELPPVPSSVFRESGTAYDLVYGTGSTPFLTLAQRAGVGRLADGVGMLVEQAADSFAWWHGVRPPTRSVIERLSAAR